MQVTLKYFAILREQRSGAKKQSRLTTTPEALYAELKERHGLSLNESVAHSGE